VIVTNADRIRLTGNKLAEKVYRRHSGYPGGLKSVPAKDLQAKYPECLIEAAENGAAVANYVSGTKLLKRDERIDGCEAADGESGQVFDVRARATLIAGST